MKDIKALINEGKYCRLFSEVQTETGKGGEYHTFNIQDGQKKFKKGFIVKYGKDNGYTFKVLTHDVVCHQGINN